MRLSFALVRRLVALCSITLFACTGRIGDQSPVPHDPTNPNRPGDPMNPVDPNDPTNPDPMQPEIIPPFAPAEASLHRLTRSQFEHTLVSLFGDGLALPTDLEVDTSLYGFTTVGASSLSIGPRAAEQFEAAAISMTEQIFGEAGRRAAFVGCEPVDANDPCIRAFVESFGRRALRRPLAEDEIQSYLAVVTTIDAQLRNTWIGVEMATSAILQSPYFLYRVELGQPDPSDSTRLRYDGYEMATRLAYFITGTTPDDALLDAAGRGDLDAPSGIGAEARRLLATPKARTALASFFGEHLKLDRLASMTKDSATFPQMTPTMPDSMRQEIERVVDDIVFTENTDLRDIFTTNKTFVNAELARLYNVPFSGGDGFVEARHADNSPRSGIFTTAGFLAVNAHATATSPTRRGKFIRGSVLCEEVPPPPMGVNTTLPEPDPNAGPQTLRQRLEAIHYQNSTCATCHLRMDPLGFAFENFDAIGAYRTTDNGLPVDPTGDVDGHSFRSARELSSILREEPGVAKCISTMAYRFASGHLETDGEKATIKSLVETFQANGFKFQELVVAVVESDGFRYAAKPVE